MRCAGSVFYIPSMVFHSDVFLLWLANSQVKLCRTQNIKQPGDRAVCLCCIQIGDGELRTDIPKLEGGIAEACRL